MLQNLKLEKIMELQKAFRVRNFKLLSFTIFNGRESRMNSLKVSLHR
jgi:hypothetical protein